MGLLYSNIHKCTKSCNYVSQQAAIQNIKQTLRNSMKVSEVIKSEANYVKASEIIYHLHFKKFTLGVKNENNWLVK
jgi:hypothetical protein